MNDVGGRSGAPSERPSLAGKRIVITRPAGQAAGFADLLTEMGAEVLILPLVSIEPPSDPAGLRGAAGIASNFDWIVFTSANAVIAFYSAMRDVGTPRGSLAGATICAVGPATAEAVEREGDRASVVAERYVAEGLLAAMEAAGRLAGARVLYPRGEAARDVLPARLRERGALVTEVLAYRTVPDARGADELRQRLARGEVDVLTFTSGSAVESFVDRVGTDPGRARVATIGPITSAAATALGLPVQIEADPYTTRGLAAAIGEYFGEERSEA